MAINYILSNSFIKYYSRNIMEVSKFCQSYYFLNIHNSLFSNYFKTKVAMKYINSKKQDI